MATNRHQIVLGGLASCGRDTAFNPVQIQKMLFLIDREIPHLVDGPHFRFVPYRFGPFDKAVYEVLGALSAKGLVHTDETGPYPNFVLTATGFEQGSEVLRTVPAVAATYMAAVAAWVRALTFRQLLSSIYAHYPDMAVKTAAPDLAGHTSAGTRHPLVNSYIRRTPTQSFLTGLARVTDIMGTLNNSEEVLRTLQASRREATSLSAIWAAVGDDLGEAMAMCWRPFVQDPPRRDPPTA